MPRAEADEAPDRRGPESQSIDTQFCLESLGETLDWKLPEIFNSDQGSQFTSTAFTSCLEASGVAISMDGRDFAPDER